jgi:hypothetical protein
MSAGVSLKHSPDRRRLVRIDLQPHACDPPGNVRLIEVVLRAGSDFDAAFHKSIPKCNFAEDDSQGHALDDDPDVRAIQLRFVVLADAHLANLKDVLSNSSDGYQRALAAQVLGYVKDKQAIAADLVAAMRDPDLDVRNNSIRVPTKGGMLSTTGTLR